MLKIKFLASPLILVLGFLGNLADNLVFVLGFVNPYAKLFSSIFRLSNEVDRYRTQRYRT